MKKLTIKLVYQDENLGEAWEKYFSNVKDVVILHEDITQIQCDAVVSPANSFGFMDGGLDYYLSERFGWDLQDRLQEKINELPMKEILVGESLIMKTNDPKVPFLISAPTMRVPMSFNIAISINAYLAMKSILLSALQHTEIETVAIPGLCTGCGRMPSDVAANQMYMAYKEIILKDSPEKNEFGDVQKYQLKINPDSMIWDF